MAKAAPHLKKGELNQLRVWQGKKDKLGPIELWKLHVKDRKRLLLIASFAPRRGRFAHVCDGMRVVHVHSTVPSMRAFLTRSTATTCLI